MLKINNIVKIDKKFRRKNFFDAEKLSKSILKKSKNKSDGFLETGNILKLLGEREISLNYYKKAVKINSKNSDAYNQIGISYRVKGNLKKAQINFEKSIKAWPMNSDAFHNLGNVFKEKKNYSKAINCYKKVIKLHSLKDKNKNYLVKPIISISKILECIYFSKGVKSYIAKLKKISKSDKCNIRLATMSSYVCSKHKIHNPYPFCKNPLNFFYTVNLKEALQKQGIKKNKILDVCKKIKAVWEPSARVTRKGYQTIDNLFEKKNRELKTIHKMIKREILNFKKINRKTSDLIIKSWPKKFKLRGWFVKLLNQGYQKSHIHPTAWLSGVFYLKIPKNLNGNQGAIKLSLHGYDYPYASTIEQIIYKPKDFDLIIFPSSLFHSTIPFSSKGERCVIPFDMVPKKQLKKYNKEQVYF